MKNSEFFKLIGYVLITFIVVWILALVSNKYFGVEINSDTAIISFIGIIATFIVVGNFSQVAEMKNQALEQTKNYNLKIEEFNAKLKEIDRLKENVEAKEKDIQNLQTEFYESQFENNMFLGMQYNINGADNIAFYLFMESFILLTKINYYPETIEVVNYLKTSIQKVDEKVYNKEIAEKIEKIAYIARDIKGIDVSKIDEIIEVIKTKNMELGY